MSHSSFSLSDLSCAPGMNVSAHDGFYELKLSNPIGSGTMLARALSPAALCAVIDFSCTYCPNIPIKHIEEASWFTKGTWFTCNLCLEGRCEVSLPPEGFAVVCAGDFCISCTDTYPHEYVYPLGRYRGIELFINTQLIEDPTFSLLSKGPTTLEDMAHTAGIAAVISENAQLNSAMIRLSKALENRDDQLGCLELLGILTQLQRHDLSCARPRVMLTRAQIELVRSIHDQMEAALEKPYDAREFAQAAKMSTSTLNGYFSNLYGETIASYLRRRRMERGREFLLQGASVAEAAVRVGYTNPSKFAAAFKRVFGETPRDARLHVAKTAVEKRGE